MNKKIKIGNITYEVIDNYKDGFNKDDLLNRYTDYFEDYDYILGDYSYGVLRLKGFCDKKNKMFKPINDIKKYKEYVEKECSYECKYFLVKRVD